MEIPATQGMVGCFGTGTKAEERGGPDQLGCPRKFMEEGALELNLEDQAAFEHIHMSPFWISTHSCHVLTQ